MNELDLMDKSKNDYQLVTELSKIVRSYKDKNKPVDRKFVNKVVDVCLINSEINLKNGVIIAGNSKILENDFNSCYVDDTIIYSSISLKNFYEMLDKFGSAYNFGDRYMLSYYSVMCTLIHEISHARQDYIVKNYPYSFAGMIYSYSNNVFENEQEFYDIYYDCFPEERNAFLRGTYISSKVMEYVYGDKLSLFFKGLFFDELLINYDYNMYPLKRFGDACKKFGYDYFDCLIPNVELTYENFLDRVWCGCELTEAEYDHLIDLNIGLFNPENELKKEHYKKTSIKSLILDKK